MEQTAFIFGLFYFGASTVFLWMVYKLITHEKGYDERQLVITYKGYKYSSFVAWALCLFFICVKLEAFTMLNTVFYVSLSTHLSYRIMNHSLTALNSSIKPWIVITSFMLFALVLYAPIALTTIGGIREDWINLVVMVGSIGTILVSLLLRQHRDQEEIGEKDA